MRRERKMAVAGGVEYDDLVFAEQPMCLEFHPQADVIAAGLINGRVSMYVLPPVRPWDADGCHHPVLTRGTTVTLWLSRRV